MLDVNDVQPSPAVAQTGGRTHPVPGTATPPGTAEIESPPRNERDEASNTFVVFAFLWVVATFFHQATYNQWVTSPKGAAVLAAAVFFLLRPVSVGRFALFLALDAYHVASLTPYTPNHILLTALINVTILAAMAWSYVRAGRRPVSGGEVLEAFAPAVRIELLMLYFFAVLHKLNVDYFNPDVSCTADLLTTMTYRYPFLPVWDWMRPIAIVGALIIEAAIPILLFVRGTRAYGIVLGMAFHLFLSLHPEVGLYSFSAMLLPLFFLFAPAGSAGALRRSLREPFRRLGMPPLLVNVLLAALLSLPALAALLSRRGPFAGHPLLQPYLWGLFVWLAYALPVMFLFLRTVLSRRTREAGYRQLFRPAFAPILVLPALMFLNGMSPYLGYKTETSFSMFSNLRTEGERSNHLFVPQSLKMAGFQDDLVRIVRSSDPYLRGLADQKLLLPYFELRRRASNSPPDFSVEYVRGGRRVVATKNDPGAGGDLFTPYPWLLTKLLQFRPVDLEGPQKCRH